ncbi:hypothetical protein lerEdw1_003154 [Lerista edwardsae]|nr:hypothetical protein lerEdw1_003154 [Lerista edwardsae]
MAQSRSNGSHYALTAIGLGMLVLGIIMAVWNLVPGFGNSKPELKQAMTLSNFSLCSQEEDEESLSRYYVPSYEEVMNRDYPDLREVDRNARISMSLPSYESLTGIDETTPTRPPPAAAAAAATATTTTAAAEARPNIERQPSRHSSRLSKRLKPLKVRRIKSEKLHLKNIRINLPDGNSSGRVTIEPLTPPPQYDEVPKKLPDSQEET